MFQALRTQEGVGSDGVVRSMTFLESLFKFLISCLEIGSNYQRKITALELYRLVLSYLADENGGARKSNGKVPTALGIIIQFVIIITYLFVTIFGNTDQLIEYHALGLYSILEHCEEVGSFLGQES